MKKYIVILLVVMATCMEQQKRKKYDCTNADAAATTKFINECMWEHSPSECVVKADEKFCTAM